MWSSFYVTIGLMAVSLATANEKPSLKVFILAGDDNVLESAPITGATAGMDIKFFAHPKPTKGEKPNHVNCSVYKGRWDQNKGQTFREVDPVATGLVEIGEQRHKRKYKRKKGRTGIPFTPFPKESYEDFRTTVLHGYLSVPYSGNYLFQPGRDTSAFNVTEVNGKEAYNCWGSYSKIQATSIYLERNKRYPFKTVFCYNEPGHAFRAVLLNKPGTLRTVATQIPKYGFLMNERGQWKTRDDIMLYDAHPVHNNTRTPARHLGIGDVSYGGQRVHNAVGIEVMLGHTLGEHFDGPVLLLRCGTRGRKSLSHDFRSPSGGGWKHEGTWDVIHFNFGIWDTYMMSHKGEGWDKENGNIRVPIDEYEKNLREMITKMKATGATLIWASTTPVHKDCPTTHQKDILKYNEVAAKVMRETGVMINDVYTACMEAGGPLGTDVHAVKGRTPAYLAAIQKALKERKTLCKPLPRVLVIGDSMSSPPFGKVKKELGGKVSLHKNPGNGASTRHGIKDIDRYLDLKTYGQNGQEYIELREGVREVLGDLKRIVPGYQGQKAELAGLVWFQGIADSKSESMASEYEKHLSNLIRDLRKDFKTPELPVVIAAVGYGGETMSERAKVVHDAQMSVSKTPEFKGNVFSIDTRKFYRPPGVSPRKAPEHYNGNAQSFLEIGEAIGNALKGLDEKREAKGKRK